MKLSVKATPWDGGWELEIAPDQYTQVKELANAKTQVIDYLDTIDSTENHSNWDIQIITTKEAEHTPAARVPA